MTTHTQFRTEEPPTGFLDWCDALVAERDLAIAEAASWEAQCLDARLLVAELRAEIATLRASSVAGRRIVTARLSLADRDAIHAEQYDGKGSQ